MERSSSPKSFRSARSKMSPSSLKVSPKSLVKRTEDDAQIQDVINMKDFKNEVLALFSLSESKYLTENDRNTIIDMCGFIKSLLFDLSEAVCIGIDSFIFISKTRSEGNISFTQFTESLGRIKEQIYENEVNLPQHSLLKDLFNLKLRFFGTPTYEIIEKYLHNYAKELLDTMSMIVGQFADALLNSEFKDYLFQKLQEDGPVIDSKKSFSSYFSELLHNYFFNLNKQQKVAMLSNYEEHSMSDGNETVNSNGMISYFYDTVSSNASTAVSVIHSTAIEVVGKVYNAKYEKHEKDTIGKIVAKINEVKLSTNQVENILLMMSLIVIAMGMISIFKTVYRKLIKPNSNITEFSFISKKRYKRSCRKSIKKSIKKSSRKAKSKQ